MIDILANVCYTSPTCAAGYTYDAKNFICYQYSAGTCSSSLETLDQKTNLCESQPVCSSGANDSAAKMCLNITQATCPTGGFLNITLNVCQASPGCSTGNSLNPDTGMCSSTGGGSTAATCSVGTLNTTSGVCRIAPTCSSGSYDPVTGLCFDSSTNSTSTPICPSVTALNLSTGQCEEAPSCPTDYIYNQAQQQCVSNLFLCPYNTDSTTYQCLDAGSGVLQCSPNPCYDLSSSTVNTTTTNTTALYNDGTTNPTTGQCSGPVYIFGGRPMTCRPPGLYTYYFNCCNSANAPSQIDPATEAAILTNPALTLPGSIWTLVSGLLNNCTSQEVITDAGIADRMCVGVGTYCSNELKLLFTKICLQNTTTYCCFHSMLGRIIQEQGRPQLKAFQPGGAWGTPQSPNCIGFTPEQFQMLDFSKMDLSEYFAQISQQMGSQVKNNMVNNVTNYYQNTTH